MCKQLFILRFDLKIGTVGPPPVIHFEQQSLIDVLYGWNLFCMLM